LDEGRLFGDQDEITEDQAVAWQRETVRRVELFRFSGRHFFLFNHAAEIAEISVRLLGSIQK